MIIGVRCADCGMTYKRTVLNAISCPDCGSREEVHVPYFNNYNFDDYITLNETGEEKLLYKRYIERENYLHFSRPPILTRLIKKLREIKCLKNTS